MHFESPEIRRYFIDDGIDEPVGNSALPRNKILDPWRGDSPRRDERLARDTASIPHFGTQRNRIFVLLGRNGDCEELFVGERVRTVVDDQSRSLAVLA